MRYLLALICPPLSLYLCRRPVQAAVATILAALALLAWRIDLGIVTAFALILWSSNVAGATYGDGDTTTMADLGGPRI